MNDFLILDFVPEFQQPTAELINAALGNRFGFRDDSMNPDLYDIARRYADHTFLIALHDQEVIATGGLLYESPPKVRIVRMHTAKPYRRQGVASSILATLERRALAYGAVETCLETNIDWHDAHAFYLAAGYRELQRNSRGVWFHKHLGSGSVA